MFVAVNNLKVIRHLTASIFLAGWFYFNPGASFAFPPPTHWTPGESVSAGDPARADDVSELQLETNDAYRDCGMPAYNWTGWVQPEGGAMIRSNQQINLIRTAIQALYTAKGLGVVPGPSGHPGAAVSAQDINSLRRALEAIPVASCGGALPVCGNNATEPPETCDPPGGACSLNCRLCGNSVVEAGETCDPPNGTTCGPTCQTVGGTCNNNGVCDPGEACNPCVLDCPCPCTVKVATGSGRNANDCHSYGAWTLSAGCPDSHPACPRAYTHGGVVFGQITASAPANFPTKGSPPVGGTLLYTVAENFYGRDQKDGWDLCSYTVYSYYDTLCYPPVCGDSICGGGETCSSCVGDCGVCPVCPNGSCESGEDCFSCEDDCGICEGDCPNPRHCPPDPCPGGMC